MGAMHPLLHKLGELLVGELTLERRVREDVLSLHRERAFMHAKLREVAELPRPGEQVALWAREVRELSYDMDDAVDAFVVRLEGEDPARGGGLKSRAHELLKRTARLFGKSKALHQIAGAVGDAQARAKQLGELRQRYEMLLELKDGGGMGSSGSTSASIDQFDPRLWAMLREATELVGVDGSRDQLIKVLSNGSEKNVRTVSIVGFGGVGKTTLARAVYDRVKVQFDCAAFVSVSRNPDITRIFKKMLYELDEEKYADINEAVRDAEQLIRELDGFCRIRGTVRSTRHLFILFSSLACRVVLGKTF